MAKNVCLGDNANFFHDPYAQVTIGKGEVKELNTMQLNSKRVKAALAQGHLSYATAEPSTNASKTKPKASTTDALAKKFENIAKANSSKGEAGVVVYDFEAIAKKFKFEELKVLAELNEVEVEEGDTEVILVETLLS